MKRLQSNLPNMFLSLTIICIVSGAILASVNMKTLAPIKATQEKILQQAIKDVTPEFNNNPATEAYMAATSDDDSLKIYPAKKDGQFVGAAIESNTEKGFGGKIEVMVGFDAKGKLLNYTVLKHSETPGLGAKMQDWFRMNKNKQNVLGRDMTKGNLKVTKDGGDVDAITAATISSRAFLNAVNRAYSAYAATDAQSGASAQAAADSTSINQGGQQQ